MTPELVASTKLHEGRCLRAYKDSLGIWTIGYGTNLQELEVTDEQATEWLLNKLRQAEVSANGYPWFAALSRPRKDVIVEMIYNLGLPRFDKFKFFKSSLAAKSYSVAANDMLDSTWATQVGLRATRLAAQMQSGEYWQ